MNSDKMNSTGLASQAGLPHICVCICTFKRPLYLRRLLNEVAKQSTGGLFTYSAVVADNDAAASARSVIEEFTATSALPIEYCVEPRPGISHARNAVLAKAEGEYLAFIDDDEFPAEGWLGTLFLQCNQYGADGVLGPVTRFFDDTPPRWLLKCQICDLRVNPTGMRVDWKESRTSNVLIRRKVVLGDTLPFRPKFKVCGDEDFFQRKIAAGFSFIWSAEAVVFEVVPPSRWTRSYHLKRSLVQGAMSPMLAGFGVRDVLKSAVAIPVYLLVLPFTLLGGQHRLMDTLIRFCFHLGKLIALFRIEVLREPYLTG
jgi:succinoglycan biosynthesis protein ExoM